MGLFDFFTKKKRTHIEQQHQEPDTQTQLDTSPNRDEELNNNEPSTDTDTTEEKIPVPKTDIMPVDNATSNFFENLAMQVNFSLNTGNEQATVSFMNQLFQSCYAGKGYKLLQISDKATQPVGLAFTSIARYLDFNDQDLNSVAAENAVYCLSRNFINTDNTFSVPAVFTLLLNYPALLKDRLISTHCIIAQEDVGMSIGLMLGGNPFNSPHLKDFREQAVSKRVPIMAYLLTFFFDEANNKYTIPTDMPYHIPTQSDISKFIRMKSEYERVNKNYISEGKRYFYKLFEECQDTLSKF